MQNTNFLQEYLKTSKTFFFISINHPLIYKNMKHPIISHGSGGKKNNSTKKSTSHNTKRKRPNYKTVTYSDFCFHMSSHQRTTLLQQRGRSDIDKKKK